MKIWSLALGDCNLKFSLVMSTRGFDMDLLLPFLAAFRLEFMLFLSEESEEFDDLIIFPRFMLSFLTLFMGKFSLLLFLHEATFKLIEGG